MCQVLEKVGCVGSSGVVGGGGRMNRSFFWCVLSCFLLWWFLQCAVAGWFLFLALLVVCL